MRLFALKHRMTRAAASHRRGLLLASLGLVAALGTGPAASADTTYSFSITGSGISASGTFTTTTTTIQGTLAITGISGYFSDAGNGISGAITGLEPSPVPVPNTSLNPPTTFTAPAFNAAGFSYDDLFYPAGNSPQVCIDALEFQGGVFDIYGVVFDVAGGYSVDMWSQGALGGDQIGDALGATKLAADDPVIIQTAATPEPGSLVLLGTGSVGMLTVARRRFGRS